MDAATELPMSGAQTTAKGFAKDPYLFVFPERKIILTSHSTPALLARPSSCHHD
jgi:hypothetical protein